MFTSLGTLDIKYQSFERISLDFGAAELWVVMKSGMFYDVFVVNDCTGCVKLGRRSRTHHRFNDIILDTHKDCGKECRGRPRVFLSFFFFSSKQWFFPVAPLILQCLRCWWCPCRYSTPSIWCHSSDPAFRRLSTGRTNHHWCSCCFPSIWQSACSGHFARSLSTTI